VVLILAVDPPIDDSHLVMVRRPCAPRPVFSVHGTANDFEILQEFDEQDFEQKEGQ
jgi:hypothetical protein